MTKWFSKLKFRNFKQDAQVILTDSCEKTEIVALDNFIIEYLWKFKKLSNELYIDEIVCIFNEMLNKNNTNLSHSIKMRLIVKLAKAIIHDNRYSVEHDEKKCIKHLVAALYLVCNQYDINFYSIMAGVIFDPSVDAKEKNIKSEIIPCNFASFADVIALEREYDLELDDILQDITDILTDYFEYLMDFIDEESLAVIKKMEILSDSNPWSMRLEMYIEEAECPSFETANLLVKFFDNDDITVDIHYWLIKSVLNKFCNSDYADVDIASEQFISIIQQMADYAKYQSIEFEMQDNWRVIIHAIIHRYDGITLNNISDIIIKSFNIPREDVENYIKEATFDYLGSLEELANSNPMNKINAIYKLLSNPTVFRVVSLTDNEIVKLF